MERKPSYSPSEDINPPTSTSTVSDFFSTNNYPGGRQTHNVPTRTQSAVGTRNLDAFSTTTVPPRPRSVNELSEKKSPPAALASSLFGGPSEDIFASLGSFVDSTHTTGANSINSYPDPFAQITNADKGASSLNSYPDQFAQANTNADHGASSLNSYPDQFAQANTNADKGANSYPDPSAQTNTDADHGASSLNSYPDQFAQTNTNADQGVTLNPYPDPSAQNINTDQIGTYADTSGYYHFDPATGQYYQYIADQAQGGEYYDYYQYNADQAQGGEYYEYYQHNTDQAQGGEYYETTGQQDGGNAQYLAEVALTEAAYAQKPSDVASLPVDYSEAPVETAEVTSCSTAQPQVTYAVGANDGGYGEFSASYTAYNEETNPCANGEYTYTSEEYPPAIEGQGTSGEMAEYSVVDASATQEEYYATDEQYAGMYGSVSNAGGYGEFSVQYAGYNEEQNQYATGEYAYNSDVAAIAGPSAAPAPLEVNDKRLQRSVSPLPPAPYTNTYTPTLSAPHDDIEQEMLADLDRIANVTSMEDPLNRKHGCPIITFGFGGKICLMFPRTVNRFSAESPTAGPVTKVYPGDMIIQPLSAIITRDTIGIPAHLGPLPTDGSRSFRDKKRKEAVEMAQKKAMDEREIAAIAKCHTVRRRHLAKEILWKIITLILEEGAGGKIEAAAQKILLEGLAQKPASSHSPSSRTPSRQLPLALESPAVSVEVYETLERCLLRGDRVAAVRLASQHGLWAQALLIASCVSRDVFAKTTGRFIRNMLNDSPSERNEDALGWDGVRLLYGLMGGMGPTAIDELLDPATEPSESDLADDAAIAELGREESEREAKEGGRRGGSNKDDIAANKGSDGNGNAEEPGKPESNFVDASALVGTSELKTGQDDQEKVTAEQRRKKRKENALSDWRRTVLLILANRPGDSAALTAYGNALRSAGMIEAAHVCYLLSPVTSHTGGLDNPKASIVLVGADHLSSPNFYKDPDALLGAEMLEFAFTFPATVGTNKGRDSPVAAGVIPHLQAYKVAHAWKLCEYGLLPDALRYCEAALAAIRTAGGKLGPNAAPNSPYYNGAFLQALRDLHDRISQSNFVNSKEMAAGSEGHGGWLSLMAKPNFDSLMDVLDRGLNKFIAGEDEAATGKNAASQVASGSGIQPAVNEIGTVGGRAGYPTAKTVHPSSELQHQPHHQPQQHQPPSNGPVWGVQQHNEEEDNHGFGNISRTQKNRAFSGEGIDGHAGYPTAKSVHPSSELQHQLQHQQQQYQPPSNGPLWGAQQYNEQQQYQPPSNGPLWGTQQYNEQQQYQPQSNGPLWGTQQYNEQQQHQPTSNAPQWAPPQYNEQQQHQPPSNGPVWGAQQCNEEEDDLGFGNLSLSQKNRASSGDGDAGKAENDQNQNAKGTGDENGSKPQLSQSSYFGILKSFLPAISRKKDEVPGTPTGGVRANLGEKSSFYYDETQKRWVNKADPSSSASTTPPPPPPPSRVQTPVMSRVGSPAPPPLAPPSPSPSPNFINSAAGVGTPPTSHRNTPSPAPSHTGALGGRPKRSVRNRYVDLGPSLSGNPQ